VTAQLTTPKPQVGTGPARPGALRRVGLGGGSAPLLTVPLLFMVVAMGVPLGYVVYTAMSGPGDASFIGISRDPLFQAALVRTIVMAAIVTVICLVLGLVLAMGLALARGLWRGLLIAALGSTFVISLMVRTYGWVILMQPKGVLAGVLNDIGLLHGPLDLLHSQPAMYIGMVHVMLPYEVLLAYTTLSSLDPLQIKAARSMGASARYTFLRVVLPQATPGLVAGSMLVFLISLSFYITPAFLGGPSQLTMGTLIGREMSQLYDFRSAAIMGTLLLGAIVLLYAMAEKLFKVTAVWERA
jgi:putative spermidine/putrescine transport system permease protein